MKPTNIIHRLTIVASLLLATARLTAQTASQPSTPPAEGNSEVIMLNTFDVNSTNDHGYTSDETTTGTRIKANLRDLPFVVNVITSDFISNFAAFEFNDQVSNVSSLSISEVQGQYQLRGVSITTQLVDGFRRLGLIDNVNIDRIDVIKGPSASIYGYIQPGGVVNITTRKPLSHQEDSVSVYAGDYDFFRVQAYSTGPMDDSGKLFYRVDLADQHRDFQQAYKTASRYYGAFQILYKPDENTSLNFKVDDVFQHEHRGNQLIWLRTTGTQSDPFRVVTSGVNAGQPQTISNYYAGLAYPNNPYNAALYNFNNSGPGEYNDRRMVSGTMIYEHKINDVLSLRDGFNYFYRQFYRLWVSGGNYSINGTTPNAISGQSPEYDYISARNVANQTDLTAKFNTGPVANTMLFTLDWSGEGDRSDERRMDTTNAALQPVNNITNFTNPNYGFTTFQQNSTLYDQPQSNYWDGVNDYGVVFNEHASMFDNRLNLLAGLRLDWINTKLDDYSVFTNTSAGYHEVDFVQHINGYPAHSLGASFRVINPVTLFVNDSNSINPQPNYVAGSGQPAPNSTSNGYEFGAKMSFLQNRLTLTVDHYYIHEYNTIYAITSTVTDPPTPANPAGVSGSVDGFVNIPLEVSHGDEVDMAWQATKSLSFIGDYSYDITGISQSAPTYLFLLGTTTRRVPENQYGAAARYQFKSGFLKGLFLVGKINYYSSSAIDISGGRAATGSGYINAPISPGATIGPWSYEGVPLNAPVPVGLTTRQTPTAPTGTPDSNIVHLADGRNVIDNEPYATTDLGIGYSFKRGGYTNRLQLNVKNIFNRQYTYGSGIAGDPTTYVFSYTLTY